MKRPERPRIEIVPTPLDKALGWLSLAGVLFTVILLASTWLKLPERVPTHFSLSGVVDGWGSRNTLLFFAIMPLVSHFGLGAIARVPWTYNYPAEVTAGNCERLYRLGRSMILWMRTETVWLFAVLEWQMIQVALQGARGANQVLVFAAVGAIWGTIICFIVPMYRLR